MNRVAVPMQETAPRSRATLEAEADRSADAVLAGRVAQHESPAPMASTRAGGGVPLEAGVRRTMESRLRADFSQVRVHADRRAASSARQLGAQAYADGENLVFGAGRYRPHSRAGTHLLAHELTHVLQQRGGAPARLCKADPLNYDPTHFTITPLATAITLVDAQARTQKAVADGKLSAASVKGAKAGSDAEIMLHVILAAVAEPSRWGTEIDIVAPIGFVPAAGGAAPMGKVTVRIDSTGAGEAVLVSAGEVALPATFAKREDAVKALKTRFGFADVTDGDASWQPSELNLVLGALARVPPGDVSALKGVVLQRVHKIVSATGESAGEFEADQGVSGTTVTNDATLRLTDDVFPAAQTSFTGDATNAAAAGYLTVLHEVGHAVAGKARRDAAKAEFDAIAVQNKAVEEHTPANEAAKAQFDVYSPLFDEQTVLHDEAVALQTAYNAAVKTGDKDAIAAAKAAFDAKNKELSDKGKQVTAEAAKLTPLQAADKTKRKKVDDAVAVVKTKAAAAEQTTARPLLLGRAKTAQTAAGAALKLAQANTQGATADSQAYRDAVVQADADLSALATAVKDQADDAAALQTTAGTALASAATARADLTTAHAGDAALAVYAPVDQAQQAWFDALALTMESGGQSLRLRKFIDFVTTNKITPFTKYARDNWPANPGEFFAEAYSLFLSDPEYLKTNSLLLHGWFAGGKYK